MAYTVALFNPANRQFNTVPNVKARTGIEAAAKAAGRVYGSVIPPIKATVYVVGSPASVEYDVGGPITRNA